MFRQLPKPEQNESRLRVLVCFVKGRFFLVYGLVDWNQGSVGLRLKKNSNYRQVQTNAPCKKPRNTRGLKADRQRPSLYFSSKISFPNKAKRGQHSGGAFAIRKPGLVKTVGHLLTFQEINLN